MRVYSSTCLKVDKNMDTVYLVLVLSETHVPDTEEEEEKEEKK